MPHFRSTSRYFAVTALLTSLIGCAPEVGSERWCKAMDTKTPGEWTANDATAYAKHCVLGVKAEE